MTTTTYQSIAERTGTKIPEHLEAQATPPLAGWDNSTPHEQGDVWFMGWGEAIPNGVSRTIGGRGHKVVSGEADRNSHILSGDGHFIECQATTDLDYGILSVPAGGEAVLIHTAEHGSIRIGPGNWRFWGQLDTPRQARVAD